MKSLSGWTCIATLGQTIDDKTIYNNISTLLIYGREGKKYKYIFYCFYKLVNYTFTFIIYIHHKMTLLLMSKFDLTRQTFQRFAFLRRNTASIILHLLS
jgi:hypothetical protein